MPFAQQALCKVTCNVDELLKKLESNYGSHKELYNQLFKLYQEKALIKLKTRLGELAEATPNSVPDLSFDIEPPDDHRQDYERAIGMLQLHRNADQKTIEITPENYAAFVQDIWGWEHQFWAKNTTMYGVSRQR